jgi:hypothetical protein
MLDVVAGGEGYRWNRPGSGENRWRHLGLRREDARQVWTKGRIRKNGGAWEGSLPSFPVEKEEADDAPSAVPGGETLVATRVRSSSPQSSQQQNETGKDVFAPAGQAKPRGNHRVTLSCLHQQSNM